MAIEYKIPLHRFDLNLLSPNARRIGTPAFKEAVILYFAAEYAGQGQVALVTVTDDDVIVMSFPQESTALDFILPMLNSGKISQAIPYLESLTRSAPANPDVFYNLGISYSELGQFDEAIIRLKRAIALNPTHSNAHIGLGNAYFKIQKMDQALFFFKKAVEINPNNGYAHRNFGAFLIKLNQLDDAIDHLKRALQIMPDDPQTIFGLSTAFQSIGTNEADEQADALLERFILENPDSPMVNQAKNDRTAFAHKRMKAQSVFGFRPDVVMYIADALEIFERVGPKKRRDIAVEIAILGSKGLDINNPQKKYQLKSLSGYFSGIQLLSIMYAALREIDLSLPTGVDFSKEYEAALKLSGKN